MWTCKHCNQEFNFVTTSEKANHSRWCEDNPKAKKYREENARRRIDKTNEKFGEFKKFEVVCNCCKSTFEVEEREMLFPSKEKYYCSRSCANNRGAGLEWAEKRNQELSHYRTICFVHHKKECVICGEQNIVGVHHMDGDHNNNDPENLIPLCPTHHQYWHSEFRYLIENTVLDYIKNWKNNLGL